MNNRKKKKRMMLNNELLRISDFSSSSISISLEAKKFFSA